MIAGYHGSRVRLGFERGPGTVILVDLVRDSEFFPDQVSPSLLLLIALPLLRHFSPPLPAFLLFASHVPPTAAHASSSWLRLPFLLVLGGSDSKDEDGGPASDSRSTA